MKKRSGYNVNETLQFSVFTEPQCQEIHKRHLGSDGVCGGSFP